MKFNMIIPKNFTFSMLVTSYDKEFPYEKKKFQN